MFVIHGRPQTETESINQRVTDEENVAEPGNEILFEREKEHFHTQYSV